MTFISLDFTGLRYKKQKAWDNNEKMAWKICGSQNFIKKSHLKGKISLREATYFITWDFSFHVCEAYPFQ